MMESGIWFLFLGALGLGAWLLGRGGKKSAPAAKGVEVKSGEYWPGTTWQPSPHKSPRSGKAIKWIVVHYTAGGKNAATWFENPESRVSAHFVVTREGEIIQCVRLTEAAWHAGAANVDGDSAVNAQSIGIELENYGRLVNTGPGMFRSESGTIVAKATQADGAYWEPYPETQLAATRELVRGLRAAYPSIVRVIGHSEIALPKGRKSDPGPLFPLSSFNGLFA